MIYEVVKPYIGYLGEVPILLPIGTKLNFWEERGFYLSESVDGYCVPVEKWAVESWTNYFRKVEL